MTLEQAIRRNPYDPKKGNESAYCRYLRYNVDDWYKLDTKEIRIKFQKEVIKNERKTESKESEDGND